MENNRRSFFKGLAAFASGVVAAKVSAYIPKKEEPKEVVFVPSTLTVMHEGVEYHPLVVKKTDEDKIKINANYYPDHNIGVSSYQNTIRKANV
jgi:hypothetical protein